MEKEWRRSMPLLSMNIVMQLTGLTARQIRYYEEQELVQPARTEGKQRMFSLDDIDVLLEIKDLLKSGVNIAGIKQIFEMKKNPATSKDVRQVISDQELRAIVKEEMRLAQSQQRASLRQGDLSRFFR
ncbi:MULTISPECIES: MerR family transcriptional regulator [unclassified Psychrobacillus]|uniref:MerR family transcriptional regulator n=1 Tax=unclassified Psychrobacillus TaxID=2636677 RepID=UPI00146E3C4A|nr:MULTISPECIES: MerR family transcriptional regulator [unclassified Psychrobacillus]MCM3360151.1 MerR family transcriptional regulator [Psychrobacillus sp. MER TA 171]NME07451.1 MerR family transcriptional regulator [Psychrobacillus sp. BL-248-WT-3]